MERPRMARRDIGRWRARTFYPKVLIFPRESGRAWHHTVLTLVITAGLSTLFSVVSTLHIPVRISGLLDAQGYFRAGNVGKRIGATNFPAVISCDQHG